MRAGVVLPVIVALGLSACAMQPPAGSALSYVAPASPADQGEIAAVVVRYLKGALPAAQTTVMVAPEAGQDQSLVSAVSERMRRAGYAVEAPGGASPAMTITINTMAVGYGYAVVVDYGGRQATAFCNRNTLGSLGLGGPFMLRDGGGQAPTALVADNSNFPAPPLLPAAAPVVAAVPSQAAPPQSPPAHTPPERYAYLRVRVHGHDRIIRVLKRPRPPTIRPAESTEALNAWSLRQAGAQGAEGAPAPASSAMPAPTQPRAPARAVAAAPLAPPAGIKAGNFAAAKSDQVPVSAPAHATKTTIGAKAGGAPVPLLPSKASPGAVVVVKAAAPPVQSWSLQVGQLLGKTIKQWAGKAGWTVDWQLPQDWAVAANASFQGSFEQAAGEVVREMAAQGANVRAQFYEGNSVMRVFQPGAANGQ